MNKVRMIFLIPPSYTEIPYSSVLMATCRKTWRAQCLPQSHQEIVMRRRLLELARCVVNP